MLDRPRAHLHLGVPLPGQRARRVDLERALPDGAGAPQVALRLLPVGVFHPRALLPAHAADLVLKLLAFFHAVVVELGAVGDRLLRAGDGDVAELLGLAEDLLGGDLVLVVVGLEKKGVVEKGG